MITKQIAGILYGNSYRLYQVATGEVYWITAMDGKTFITFDIEKTSNNGVFKTLLLSQIGTDFLIIARPLSDLTKEIEGVGVPFVELAKLSCPFETFGNEVESIQEYGLDSEVYVNLFNENGQRVLWCLTYYIHHNCFMTDKDSHYKGKCDNLELFNKLHEWHFAVNLPEGTWIDINQIEK